MKQTMITIVAKYPNDFMGMISLMVHDRNAELDVKDVTSIAAVAFLHTYESLKSGLSFKAGIKKEFYQ